MILGHPAYIGLGAMAVAFGIAGLTSGVASGASLWFCIGVGVVCMAMHGFFLWRWCRMGETYLDFLFGPSP